MTEYKDKWCQEAYNKGFKEGRDFEKGQLTKAKELLKQWVNSYGYIDVALCNQTDQFISEVEK